MKKYLLSLAVVCFVASLSAQSDSNPKQKNHDQFKVAVQNHKPAVGQEQTVFKQEQASAKPTTGNFQKDFQEVVIGHSFYDTQTNGCIQKRVIRGADYIEAAWTMAQEPTFNDRGTGYVKYENTLWGPEPLERLESERVGWPSLLETGGGRLLSLAHSNAPYHITMTYRDAGETVWTETSVPTDLATGVLWGHGCVGGTDTLGVADNNTIHLLALSTPTAFTGGALVDGQDGTIRYYRSSDQGDTWDVVDFLIPGMGIEDYLSMGPDSYDITCSGDRVVIGLFHDWADSKVFISEDGGDNWNSTILRDFPVDLHPVDVEILDLNEDMLADTVWSTDGSGQVFIDAAGQAHAAYGDMFYLDEAVGAADGWVYFPGVDGLNYWNESFGADSSQYVGYLIDLDESDSIDLADDIAAYGTCSTSHPTFGEDATGNLYITYSGIVESHATGTQNYRHLHAVKSENGGISWTEPKDLTPDLDYIGYEYAFPVLADVVDDQLHIICQRDGEPGTSLTDADPTAENEWIYFGITTDLEIDDQVSIDEVKDSRISIYPVPARDIAYVNLGGLGAVNMDIYNMVGRLVLSQFENNNIATLDVSNLATGVYTLAVTKEGKRYTSKLIVE